MTDSDYFTNHNKVLRFPWSLYHRPLQDDLISCLQSINGPETPRVLVVGSGLLHEIADAPEHYQYTVTDIDKRALDKVKELGHPNVKVRLVNPEESYSEWTDRYDFAYAKEVIEHIPQWLDFLKELRTVLNPGGQLWLSTPNYGEPWLPAVESTVLEWVARRQGFSRKHIHPAKLNRKLLSTGLADAGYERSSVRAIWNRMALVAHAYNPQ